MDRRHEEVALKTVAPVHPSVVHWLGQAGSHDPTQPSSERADSNSHEPWLASVAATRCTPDARGIPVGIGALGSGPGLRVRH